ncbi:MAG: DUF4349 domain-containing protein [Oscillospiraceae bacterium]|nr:DUF4349 domain-containing protein [Oscillospiraceae bacterium]
MKKRFVAVLAAVLVMALALCGCSKGYDNAGSYAKNESAYSGGYAASSGAYSDGYDSAEYEAPKEESTDSGTGNLSTDLSKMSAGASQKMIYTAWAEIQTIDFDGTIASLERMIDANGAFLESSSISGKSYYDTYYSSSTLRRAFYEVRVPAERFSGMKNDLGQLGYVTNLSSDAQNITTQYTDVESRLLSLRTQEERLLALLEKAETVEDIITIEQTLSESRYEIEALTSTLRNYDSEISYSTINITINEVEEIVPVQQVRVSYGERIAAAFKNSVQSAVSAVKDAIVYIIEAIPILIVVVIGCALALVVLVLIIRLLKAIVMKTSGKERKNGGKKSRRKKDKEKKDTGKTEPAAAQSPADEAPHEDGEDGPAAL